MKTFFLCAAILLLCAGLAPLSAQEQEKKVLDKLFGKPDMSLEYVPRTSSGQKLLKEFNSPTMRIKPFLFRERFSSKEFRTEAFHAKKFSTTDYLSGKKPFETKDGLANWRKSAAPVKDALGMKDYEVAEAREAGKKKPDANDKTYETKGTTLPGKGQKELDATYHERPALTIDQVRELLNKNK